MQIIHCIIWWAIKRRYKPDESNILLSSVFCLMIYVSIALGTYNIDIQKYGLLFAAITQFVYSTFGSLGQFVFNSMMIETVSTADAGLAISFNNIFKC